MRLTIAERLSSLGDIVEVKKKNLFEKTIWKFTWHFHLSWMEFQNGSLEKDMLMKRLTLSLISNCTGKRIYIFNIFDISNSDFQLEIWNYSSVQKKSCWRGSPPQHCKYASRGKIFQRGKGIFFAIEKSFFKKDKKANASNFQILIKAIPFKTF